MRRFFLFGTATLYLLNDLFRWGWNPSNSTVIFWVCMVGYDVLTELKEMKEAKA